ncbi:MAG: pilus assembly protein PilP [Chromatiales bacterium]|jgi:type IV pilus assembly protein PilP|nr:pilus assembly protein PilP [Chromatiales bacterium]
MSTAKSNLTVSQDSANKPRRVSRMAWPLLVSSTLLLAACGDSSTSDLHEFVAEAKQRPGKVEPLPQFSAVETYAYSAVNLRDPFGGTGADLELKTASAQDKGQGGLSPDINRRKEALESYPLDSLLMLGTLKYQDTTWGLVKAPDGIVHRVRAGYHLGQNYGKVKAIQAQRLTLTEIVPDGLGGWEEREAYLAMNEQ